MASVPVYPHLVYMPLQESIDSMVAELLKLSTKVDFKVEDGLSGAHSPPLRPFGALCSQMTHRGILQYESRARFLSLYIRERGGLKVVSSP